MRCFEILIPVCLMYTLVVLFFVNKPRRALIFSAISITTTVVLCHLLFERSRWQMVPTYLFTITLFFICLRLMRNKGQKKPGPSSIWGRLLRISGISLSFLLLLLTLVPPSFLPVFRLPKPTGPHDVGTSTLFFTDKSRLDIHSEGLNKYRELSVRVWYPAVADGLERPVPYMKAEEARALAELYHMPSFLLGHFTRVKTDSYVNAPQAKGSYPVVFYSPSGDMVQNTTLFQELASHGYVIFSVGHPYWNAFYYDQSGQAVPFDKNNDYYQAMWEEETSDTVNHVKELITAEKDLDNKRMLHQKLNLIMPLEVTDIKLWAEDLKFLLDQIESGDPSFGLLLNLMDESRVGVIGFSKGGAAAGQFAVTDSRCRAGINLSGFMFGDVVDSGLKIPFMIFENKEEWCQDCHPICEVLYEDAISDAFMIRIEGARHGNFSDWSLVGKFLQLSGVIGPIKGSRCLEIQNNYLRSFFDRYLKGIDSPMLTEYHLDYPEVQFISK